MLPGHNVFDVVEQLAATLVETAVLALLASPFADESARSGVHFLLQNFAQMTPGLELQH